MGLRADASTTTAVFRALSDSRRRAILRHLLDRSAPVAIDDLAAQLVAGGPRDPSGPPFDVPSEYVASDDVSEVRADLVHSQLPRLEAPALVDWDRDDGVVAAACHPAFSHPWFRRLVETSYDDVDPDLDAEELDRVLACLADDRRREVLTVLRRDGGVLSRTELAKAIVARQRERTRSEEPTGSGESSDDALDSGVDASGEVVLSLHHVHLPKLERAGLVTYHADDGTVSYVDHPLLTDGLFSDTSLAATDRTADAEPADLSFELES